MTVLVRTSHHVLMRQAYNAADAILQLRRKTMPHIHIQDVVYLDSRLRAAQDHYIVLKINRQSVLSDAFDQLWHRERRELLRPLRVRMGIDEGEIGHDLGGVQIEFFKLVCQEAFNPAYCQSILFYRVSLHAKFTQRSFLLTQRLIWPGSSLQRWYHFTSTSYLVYYSLLRSTTVSLYRFHSRWPFTRGFFSKRPAKLS